MRIRFTLDITRQPRPEPGEPYREVDMGSHVETAPPPFGFQPNPHRDTGWDDRDA